MSTTTTEKKIQITLSDRAPVKIVAADWPVIAKADTHDGQVRCQANNEWVIKVREHKDGRRIVYGWHDAGGGGQYSGFEATYVGYLLTPGDDTVRAIRRVAGAIGRDSLGDFCIGELPAEEI